MRRRSGRPARRALLGLIASSVMLAALAGATPALASEAPWWQVSSSSTPTYLSPSHEGTIVVTATNLGDANVQASNTHPVTIADQLPAGLKITGMAPVAKPCENDLTFAEEPLAKAEKHTVCGKQWPSSKTESTPVCTSSGSSAICTFTGIAAPYEQWAMQITVKVEPGAKSGINEVKVKGGEAPGGGEVPEKSLERALTVNSAETPFGVENLELAPENKQGEPEAQAGSHPFQLTTTLALNRIYHYFAGSEHFEPSVPELVKDLHVNLPPGLIGDTLALEQCTELQFTTRPTSISNGCPGETAVGVAVVSINDPANAAAQTLAVPVFNLAPSVGEPARFGFTALGVPVTLDTVVSGGDYHVVVNVNNASEEPAILGSIVTIWGVPGDPSHNQSRGWACVDPAAVPGETCEANVKPPSPFLRLPTSCGGPLQTSVEAESWLYGASFLAPVVPSLTEELNGCGELPFTPEIGVTPQEQQTNTPSGLTVVLKVPQTSFKEENALSQADLRNTVVKLPVGMQLSPSAANGLNACSLKAIGFKGVNKLSETDEFYAEEAKVEEPAEEAAKEENEEKCPKASKVGTVEIKTPVLKQTLKGSVYLAAQEENPFHSLFAMYIVVKDPVSGVVVKLAGEVALDPTTGQITSTFKNAPQLPFEELKLTLFSGPRASLATPRACGAYTTQASLTPWSGNPTLETSLNPGEFAITSGAHGTQCSNPQPFGPGFQAGSTNNQAGALTPFTLTLTREDTEQAVKGVEVTLPPGLAGLLSKVKLCPEPQAEEGTCGAESQIGHATASVGLGSDPFTETGGRVYITGPYHGAPFGLSIVIPAVAGPFNFGNVVTRSTINVNRSTAAITINSELPTMLNTTTHHTGVPVQLRRVDVTIERPGGEPFQFNPTNCTPMTITGALTGDQGASAAASYPFQVANCAALPFAPKLTATVGGQASKVNGASLNVKIVSAGLGQANIAKVDLQLPEALPSRLSTIQKACVEAVFNANPAACDEGSVIGYATIHTPVLTSPLTGPAYLVSRGGAAFPDVEFVLQGEGITLLLDGKTNIKNGITYSRFESSPDAPFTTFETVLPTGPHSALTAYVPVSKAYNLCGTSLVMPTEITAQNGNVIKETTNIALTGCGGVLSSKVKLTRAQLLAKALKACKKDKKKSKRIACQKQAHKKYGPIPKKKAKKK